MTLFDGQSDDDRDRDDDDSHKRGDYERGDM